MWGGADQSIGIIIAIRAFGDTVCGMLVKGWAVLCGWRLVMGWGVRRGGVGGQWDEVG